MDKTYFLVNGSTVGILTGISACVSRHGKILIARNAHKSTYNAVCLRALTPVYIYPDVIEGYGFFDAVKPADVEAALRSESGIEAVVVISPTYEGRIADIREIAEIAHRYGVPLVVDAAHGAHLSFAFKDGRPISGYGESACMAGADIVVESTHKTLPAPTQTAVLHVCKTHAIEQVGQSRHRRLQPDARRALSDRDM